MKEIRTVAQSSSQHAGPRLARAPDIRYFENPFEKFKIRGKNSILTRPRRSPRFNGNRDGFGFSETTSRGRWTNFASTTIRCGAQLPTTLPSPKQRPALFYICYLKMGHCLRNHGLNQENSLLLIERRVRRRRRHAA